MNSVLACFRHAGHSHDYDLEYQEHDHEHAHSELEGLELSIDSCNGSRLKSAALAINAIPGSD